MSNILKTGDLDVDELIESACEVSRMNYPKISEILKRDLRMVEADAMDRLSSAVVKLEERRPVIRLV